MADDRADEIAREIMREPYSDSERRHVIAAALCSYGREMVDAKLEEAISVISARRWTAPDLHADIRSLKSKPEAQDTP